MIHTERPYSRDLLALDVEAEIDRICGAIRRQVGTELHRRGAVLGLSGGIDSSVTAALCVRALGPERVLVIFLPERESPPKCLRLGQMAAEALGVRSETWDVTAMLEAAGSYRLRDEAVRLVLPEYVDGWRCKISVQSAAGGSTSFFHVLAEAPNGGTQRVRLTPEAYLGVLSAMNIKQRVRKIVEYYYADRLVYAVASTANRLECDQGFFVKNGNGAGDFRPIAHLFKTQVYALAEALGVPEEIRRRPLAANAYPLEQEQGELNSTLSHESVDLCLLGFDRNEEPAVVAEVIGLPVAEVEEMYRTIVARRRQAEYLRAGPLTVES